MGFLHVSVLIDEMTNATGLPGNAACWLGHIYCAGNHGGDVPDLAHACQRIAAAVARALGPEAECACCSAAACLPRKLARLVLATQDAALGGASLSCALADMFPRDMAPLVDMSGKRWAHTVRPLFVHGCPSLCAPGNMFPCDIETAHVPHI